MGTIRRLYYGGTDVFIGAFLLANAGYIAGGYADILAMLAISRGFMTLSRIFLLGG